MGRSSIEIKAWYHSSCFPSNHQLYICTYLVPTAMTLLTVYTPRPTCRQNKNSTNCRLWTEGVLIFFVCPPNWKEFEADNSSIYRFFGLLFSRKAFDWLRELCRVILVSEFIFIWLPTLKQDRYTLKVWKRHFQTLKVWFANEIFKGSTLDKCLQCWDTYWYTLLNRYQFTFKILVRHRWGLGWF